MLSIVSITVNAIQFREVYCLYNIRTDRYNGQYETSNYTPRLLRGITVTPWEFTEWNVNFEESFWKLKIDDGVNMSERYIDRTTCDPALRKYYKMEGR